MWVEQQQHATPAFVPSVPSHAGGAQPQAPISNIPIPHGFAKSQAIEKRRDSSVAHGAAIPLLEIVAAFQVKAHLPYLATDNHLSGSW